jgi:hypothetical protein
MIVKVFVSALVFTVLLVMTATAAILENSDFKLILDKSEAGSPVIRRGVWKRSDRTVFEMTSPVVFMDSWGHNSYGQESGNSRGNWVISADEIFTKGFLSIDSYVGIRKTFVVELASTGSLFRIYTTLENTGRSARSVSWYPVWKTTWDVLQGGDSLQGWEALSYVPFRKQLRVDGQVMLGSRAHSSDRLPDGQVPYWSIGRNADKLSFSLEWCGGWKAEISRNDYGTEWSVWLPQEETQLVLHPGEVVTGPVITIVVTSEQDEMNHRAAWITQRSDLAKRLYGDDISEYLLVWNHWYSITRRVNYDYLMDQLPLLDDFGFDAFVIDDGWFPTIGDWSVHKEKFGNTAKFKALLDAVKSKGMYAGLWSCPQFAVPDENSDDATIYEPMYYRPYLSRARLYDLHGTNFEKAMLDHVAMLVNEYGANWWKYDQNFFVRYSRHGVLKNVEEFQRGLIAVRKQFPGLYIENCQSGGRMVNDLTTFVANIHWLRDGGKTGYEHARTNIAEVLGALQFLPGWTCQRWTNRLHQNNPLDDELTKLYCRSAMPGIWGISEDLSKIKSRPLQVIKRQVDHYRKINTLKLSGLRKISYPTENSDMTHIVYYDESLQQAAVLVFRWEGAGTIRRNLELTPMRADQRYRVTNVDSGLEVDVDGEDITKKGFELALQKAQLSTIYFVEPVKAE